MQKKKSRVVADKAWNLLRLALLWARKVGVLKRGLKVKGLGNKAHSDQIHYLERQLSFDRTPDFHVKKDHHTGSMQFLFPCVGANTLEFDYDIGDDEAGGFYGNYSGREIYLEEEKEEEGEEYECNGYEKKSQLEDEGIDSRAEKFIAEFYAQIRFRN
ncbi:uncharacterized protein LOC111316409 [Durio zibethinus]|uniref:Uncharacterized protein LOC111316409 n=1 Tax=Durio zibethinus TaxID=66656 RepID=A0A6P6BAI1_DURZI|nr:uncharacterized protein LOC111316409 [Durio zibethinus]